ncbi:hypothetical protein [Azospirillum soli]|uniref:hypothetical protein n=1 Tax=Azospirillum soli TaxID=1304799 RepID=UPI001AEA702F|nr:hypothetical protein [Azospirillum soli]MBP2310940.1 hypothetical protein [Azospirillum soli]
MRSPSPSSAAARTPLISAALSILLLAGCAETRMTDRVAVGGVPSSSPPLLNPVVQAVDLGRTLLVPITGFRSGDPDQVRREAEVERVVRETVAGLPIRQTVTPDTLLGAPPEGGWAGIDEGRLVAAARAAGLDTVLILRVDDYARTGAITVALAVPPVTWETETKVAVQVRLLDVRSGTVRTDLRRLRERGGLFALRGHDELPAELSATVRSLIASKE